jgi:hypothetical protein
MAGTVVHPTRAAILAFQANPAANQAREAKWLDVSAFTEDILVREER